MARFAGAQWRPIPVNFTHGGMGQKLGVVLHIMEGTLGGTDTWFRNPAAQASAHFGTGKDGEIFQWVDTDDKAWAQKAGNPAYLSIENEGQSGEALTNAQLAAVAAIVGWASTTHGIPLQLADAPGQRGLGWHGMGGAAWGSHLSCPGEPIKNQRGQILTQAGAPAAGGAGPPAGAGPSQPPAWPGTVLVATTTGHGAQAWQQRLRDRGWSIGVDDIYGPRSATICQQFQRQKGLTADGKVGPETWAATFSTTNVKP